MSQSAIEQRLCALGATAVHLNTGKTWTVVERLNGGYLVIRDPGGFERKVSTDYWMSGSWADR